MCVSLSHCLVKDVCTSPCSKTLYALNCMTFIVSLVHMMMMNLLLLIGVYLINEFTQWWIKLESCWWIEWCLWHWWQTMLIGFLQSNSAIPQTIQSKHPRHRLLCQHSEDIKSTSIVKGSTCPKQGLCQFTPDQAQKQESMHCLLFGYWPGSVYLPAICQGNQPMTWLYLDTLRGNFNV